MRMTSDAELLAAALRYAGLGYKVFPCVPRDKVPLTEHGHLEATCDIKQIEKWWRERPAANIGIVADGLLVIDVDGANNPWPGDADRGTDLASAPTSCTPGGGRHRVFRKPEGKEWRCTEGRLAPGVDTRTDGGYFVAPPSVVDGKVYRWVEGLELDIPPSSLPVPPVWLAEALDCLDDEQTTEIVGDANPIPKGQRNKTLARLGGSMRRVGMGRAEIAAALHAVNGRCVPPLSDRDVERVSASIARYAPDQVATAIAEGHWEQMVAATAPAGEEREVLAPADPGPTPPELLQVPGFVGDVMAYTLDTAPYAERTLAFAGALSLQALLAGRKVRDELDNRTNLYVLGLANSGAGKDYPRRVNERVLVEAGLAECLGSSFASGEGIEDRLFVEPATLFQVDELDGLLQRVNHAKDARHEQIISILLQMYSSAAGVYVMRAKADRERAVIDQPCLCVFGTAVPKYFYESISARLLTNGFLARMLILEAQRRGRGRPARVRPLPPRVVETARWWAEFVPGAKPGNLSAWHPQPRVVEATPEAEALLDAFRARADDEYARAEERGDPPAMAIWARSHEKARRLALLHACSANHASPDVDAPAAAWACAFVEHQTRRMLYMAGCHVSESEFDAKRKRLLEVLGKWQAAHGHDFMPFWMINRKLPWTTREHEDVRDTLLAQQMIEYQVNQTAGRPGVVYRLAPTSCRPK
jgi:hypothetical protein